MRRVCASGSAESLGWTNQSGGREVEKEKLEREQYILIC